jgi:cytochrome c-type biogenesis protein CcmH
MTRLLLVLFALMLAAAPARAVVDPDEMLKDPAQEARARALSKQLRCLVCQNQSIDDSNAPLARDLRRLVRERIAKGDTDAQVIAFLVARYGDFVLLKPPVGPGTWLLWFGPGLFLLGGAAFLWRRARLAQSRREDAPAPLSDAERAALDRVLKPPGGSAP